MSLHEVLADMVLMIHAAFSVFVILGLVFILTGMLLGWAWTDGWGFRTIHLAATLLVVARVWLGVPCPFSTAEDGLRAQATVPCVLGPTFHTCLHRLAFRGNDPQRFARAITFFGLAVVAGFALNRPRRRTPRSNFPKPRLGQATPFLVVAFSVAGASTNAAEARPRMRDFIGINGHTVQFKPDLYQPVCRLVRDYHPVEWDLGKNTAEEAPFPFAKNRVDWSKVYGSWREKGWDIDVSLMFESIKRTNWTDIEADAKAYGRAFAREFGPSGQRKLVNAVEIGNEPGDWNDADYTRLFRAMAEGLREGDAQLKIATCNVTTGKSGKYEKSAECIAKLPQFYDLLNVHTYAQLESWPTWRRSFPEDPKLPKYLQDVEALCRWRDTNAPGKPVWVTEFGYDSSTKPAEATGDFAKWAGVTDDQQAQWLVRSLLIFSAMPIERAYIYFFDDKDKPALHASSGITRNFKPKPSYHALAHLQRTLGDYRFHHVVTNDSPRLRIQEYRHDQNSKKVVWAIWSPTGEGKRFNTTLDPVPGTLADAQRMQFAAVIPPVKPRVRQDPDGRIEAEVDESPLFLLFDAP